MLKREVGLQKQQHNPIAGEGAHEAIDAPGRRFVADVRRCALPGRGECGAVHAVEELAAAIASRSVATVENSFVKARWLPCAKQGQLTIPSARN